MKYKHLTIFFVLLFSCDPKVTTQDEVAAIINSDSLYINTIDNTIQNELYEGLFGIYYYRKIALEELVKEHLLSKEAKANKISKAQLIKDHVDNMLSESGLQYYIQNNELESGFPDPTNPLSTIDSNSEYGKILIKKSYREYNLKKYITSLKKKYEVKVYLTPPSPPRKNLYGIEKHFNGNQKSTTSIILVSAFDCPQCSNFYPVYQRLYKKYKDRVAFGQVHLAPEVTLPIIVSEYAHTQLSFWEMYDLIYEKQPKDTIDYFQLAKQMSFDSVQLANYLSNTEVKQKIQSNLEALMAEDIVRTPSILINDRMYYGGFSFEKISEYLDTELGKIK